MIFNLQYKARSAEPLEYHVCVSVAALGTEVRTRALFLVLLKSITELHGASSRFLYEDRRMQLFLRIMLW